MYLYLHHVLTKLNVKQTHKTMQDNEIKGKQRKDIREYLRDELSSRDYDNFGEVIKASKSRATKMLNYVPTIPWLFDHFVALFRKLDIEILPSIFIQEYGLIHELSELQIEALDQLLDD